VGMDFTDGILGCGAEQILAPGAGQGATRHSSVRRHPNIPA
jgi:hypothetical protein